LRAARNLTYAIAVVGWDWRYTAAARGGERSHFWVCNGQLDIATVQQALRVGSLPMQILRSPLGLSRWCVTCIASRR